MLRRLYRSGALLPTTAMLVVGALLFTSGCANAAVTMTQWNFNSVVGDGTASTGSLLPSVGNGTATLIGATSTFADGAGSSDPTSADDSGWNLAGFAGTSTGSQTRGAQWMVNTSGYGSISLSFDQRNSPTASRFWAVHYTLDGGTSWVPFNVSGSNTTSGLFEMNVANAWFNGLTVDLSSVTGADNNALFGVRLLSSFAPAGTSYSPTDVGATYGTTGTARFDMVTFSGNVVPEPSRAMLMLLGLSLAFSHRRRQAA